MGLFDIRNCLVAGAEAVDEDTATVVVVITGVVEGPDADMEAGAEGAQEKLEDHMIRNLMKQLFDAFHRA